MFRWYGDVFGACTKIQLNIVRRVIFYYPTYISSLITYPCRNLDLVEILLILQRTFVIYSNSIMKFVIQIINFKRLQKLFKINYEIRKENLGKGLFYVKMSS